MDMDDSCFYAYVIHNFGKSRNYFMASALFTQDIVQKFSETWKGDSSMDGDKSLQPCIGYMLGNYESPFGCAVDKL